MYRVHLAWAGFELTMLVVICTHCISSYKSNYHTIIICSITCILFVKVYVTYYSDEDDEMDDSVVVLDEEEDEDEDLDQGQFLSLFPLAIICYDFWWTALFQ